MARIGRPLCRVSGFLESGRSDGATALAGGGRFGDRGYFIEPTVLTNTRPDMKVVREEIFGPVVVAAPFSDLDQIAAEANDSGYGLGAGIWTKDISKAHALAKKPRPAPPSPRPGCPGCGLVASRSHRGRAGTRCTGPG